MGCFDVPSLPPSSAENKRKVVEKKSGVAPVKPTLYYVQPFSDISTQHSNFVFNELKKVCPNLRLLPATKLPKTAYYKPRNRYRADSLINWLSQRTQANTVVIGLTSKDISTTKGSHADWGVMGLSSPLGKTCIASSYRLRPSIVKSELFQVAIHELGHSEGLAHCPIPTCYMRDAEGGSAKVEETGFCQSCKKVLVSKGWTL